MPVVRKTSHQGPVDALPQSKSSVQTSHHDVTKLLAVFLCMLGRQVPTCLPKAPPGNITEEDYRLPSKGQKSPPPGFCQNTNSVKKCTIVLVIAKISLSSILNTEITR